MSTSRGRALLGRAAALHDTPPMTRDSGTDKSVRRAVCGGHARGVHLGKGGSGGGLAEAERTHTVSKLEKRLREAPHAVSECAAGL